MYVIKHRTAEPTRKPPPAAPVRFHPLEAVTTTSLDGVDIKTSDAGELVTTTQAVGFIRVRKRKLKGGWAGTTSASFDLVRAVRVGGKPRHVFVLGLGSQKNKVTGRVAAEMLLLAVGRMKRHGLDEPQRRALLTELIRKGARRPTVAEVEGWNANDSWTPYVDELVAWLRAPAEAEVRS